MDNPRFKHLKIPPDDVLHYLQSVRLLKVLLFLQQLLQIPLIAVLLNDITVILSEDDVEHLHQMVRIQLLHHVNFVLEEVFIVLVGQSGLLDDFDGYWLVGTDVLR